MTTSDEEFDRDLADVNEPEEAQEEELRKRDRERKFQEMQEKFNLLGDVDQLKTKDDLLDVHESLHAHWVRCIENMLHLKNDEKDLLARAIKATSSEEADSVRVELDETQALQNRVMQYQADVMNKGHALESRRREI